MPLLEEDAGADDDYICYNSHEAWLISPAVSRVSGGFQSYVDSSAVGLSGLPVQGAGVVFTWKIRALIGPTTWDSIPYEDRLRARRAR